MRCDAGLTDRSRVVVTGAASGIGRECALRLATSGARLLLADVDLAALEETAQIARRRGAATVVSASTDVTDPVECARMVESADESFGGIDGTVLSAGTARHVPLLDMSRSEWDAMLAVHLTGAFLCIQAVARLMVSRGTSGSLVYIGSSVAAGLGPPRQAHYVAGKAGALGLVRAAARELGPFGIRVNAVSPGFTRTPLNTGLFRDEELRDRAAAAPLGRVAEPADVAGAVEFLLGPAGGFMTGQTLHVNGGAYMP